MWEAINSCLNSLTIRKFLKVWALVSSSSLIPTVLETGVTLLHSGNSELQKLGHSVVQNTRKSVPLGRGIPTKRNTSS